MKVKVKKVKRNPAPIKVEQEKNKTINKNNEFISIDLKAMCNNITTHHLDK